MSTPKPPPAEKDLRDEFAMVALSGMALATASVTEPAKCAKAAYAYADAMMEARKK